MAFFNPSLKAVSAACQEIADTIGASADADMTTRAGRSLFAAFEHFNNRANWDFTLTEATPLTVVAPFTVGLTIQAGQSSALAPTPHGIKADDVLLGQGFLAGTRVLTTAASSVTFNQQTSLLLPVGDVVMTATAVRDFYDLPADWKAVYSVRLYGAQRVITLARRRLYDRSVTDEFQTSNPMYYDVFGIGGKGKIRLLQPPGSSDTMQLRYYRRLTVPTTTATADGLDIPQDYEPYLIAWAKWHYLVDKAEGRSDQATTWITFANDGLRTMLSDQTRIPDEDLAITPGHFANRPYNVNSTRDVWDY